MHRKHGPLGAGTLRTARAGQAAVAAIFWLIGVAVFVGPFLRDRAAMDPEGDDPGRKISEIDFLFEEDVANFEADFELPLGAELAAASEAWFGEDSEQLRESGLFELARIEPGRRAYEAHCTGCHSAQGNGGGPAASHLAPRPRNFRRGVFKFTSTPTGRPPTRADLFRTITRGLAGSSMPEFRLLSEERRWDLVEYVRYLAVRGEFEQRALDYAWDEEDLPDFDEAAEIVLERWGPEKVKPVYPPTAETERTPEAVERGRALFVDPAGANCAACHGEGGKGDGPTAGDYTDEWGYPIRPRDLTMGTFRAGESPADLYRSIATGINGTPMPSYEGTFEAEDIWAMVHYILSLSEGTR